MIRLCVLLFTCFWSVAPAWGAVAFVQSKSNLPGASGTSVSVTLTGNVVATNLLAVVCLYDSISSVSSVTDSLANTFTLVQAVADTSNRQGMQTAYAKNIAGGADTVTCNFAAAVGLRGIMVHEISGASTTTPLDGNAMNWQLSPGTGTNAVTSGTFTTTATDYILGALLADDGACPAPTVTAGTSTTAYQLRETPTCLAGLVVRTEDPITNPTSGTHAATFTIGTNNSTITGAMAFQPAAAAAARGLFRLAEPLTGVGIGGSFFKDPLQ